jgi:hypothetical protein
LWGLLLRVQDKLLQKRHFQAAGVPVADFAGVEDTAAAQAAAQAFGFPFMLKSRRFCKPYLFRIGCRPSYQPMHGRPDATPLKATVAARAKQRMHDPANGVCSSGWVMCGRVA